jgi:hypothetical protein
MPQLDNIRRILKEDYPKKYHDVIDKLAFTLNRFMDQVVGTMNGNIDFDNLNQEVTTFSMTVDSSGTPVGNNLFKVTQTNVAGFIVISAVNRTDGSLFPTSTPFISATRSKLVVKVNNISGLQADNKYDFTVMIIGN